MTRPDGTATSRARFAVLLLRPFLGRDEAEASVGELEELARSRRGMRGTLYFWLSVAGYPARVLAERATETNLGRGGMDGLWRDVRYAVRSLRRSPGFAVMTVAILAVSMGAAAAIFSVVRGVLLEPLPVEEPDRLVSLWLLGEDGRRRRMMPGSVTDVRVLDDVFESVAAYQGASAALSLGTEAVFVRGGAVDTNYFRTFGVQPLVGRDFMPEEGVANGPTVVILSEALWRRAFGADPDMVGRLVDLNGIPFEVVGVVPTGVYPTTVPVSTDVPFTAANQDYFVPLQFTEQLWDLRRPHIIGAVARLRHGVTREQAVSALDALTAGLSDRYPNYTRESLVLNPFVDEVVGDVRLALFTLLGTVGLVLLIAVVNVGALFVLRADDRTSEIDVRVAMGAPWARLTRQLLVESVLVAAVASVGAIVIARWGIEGMRRMVPYQIPRLDGVAVDGGGLLVVLAVGAALAIAFGLGPAWRMLRSRVGGGARGTTAGHAQRRLQSMVVATQAGLGVVVLVGAMLLTRSFLALRSVDTGFTALEAWVVPISGAGDRMQDIVERVRTIPGVRSAAVTYDHPLQRNWGDSFLIEGRVLGADERPPSGSLRPFGNGYFETAGIAVVEGRVPDAVDLAGEAGYAVINESLRDRFFPVGGALGAVITVPTAQRMSGDEAAGSYTIAAVVEDVRFMGPEQPSGPAFYLPLTHFASGASLLMVRPEVGSVEVVQAVRQAVAEVAPGAAIRSARRMQDVLDDLLARPRFNMMLLVSFAAMALVLSGLGAYGLVGRAVVSRMREIGIRMALGADGSSVARSVMVGAMRPMLVGGALGILLAAALVRSLRSLLFGISPGDPLSFVASAVFLLVVGGVAALAPMLRALRVDPARSLRTE